MVTTKLKIKKGVQMDGLTPLGVQIIEAAMKTWDWFEEPELVITSAVRAPAAVFSYHQEGRAVDLRRWTVTDPITLCEALQIVLGPTFQVLLESDHIHVEHDPNRYPRSG